MFSGKKHNGKNRNTLRLGVERLESRKMMAVGADVYFNILEIEGSESADVISIDNVLALPTGNWTFATYQPRIQVTIRDRATNELLLQWRFDPDWVQGIYVASFGGNDRVINNTNIPSEIYGGGGHNELFGGGAHDRLFGAGGNDDLYGRGGSDELFGGLGNDDLWGGDGNDWLYGEAGYDELWGEAGNDSLRGGAHDDDLFGGEGNDYLCGDIEFGTSSDHGDDYMVGGGGDDFMEGMGGNDIMYGQDGRDTLHGWSGDDDLYGGANEDTMHGGSGYDFFETGTGTDHVYFSLTDESLDGQWAWVYLYAPNVVDGTYAGSKHWTF